MKMPFEKGVQIEDATLEEGGVTKIDVEGVEGGGEEEAVRKKGKREKEGLLARKEQR